MDVKNSLIRYYQVTVWLVCGLVIVSVLGFRKSYFNFLPAFNDTSWVIHFHVISIFCWYAMLILQASLAKIGRFAMHRYVGRASYFLVLIILIGFALVTNHGQLKNKSPELLGATIFDASLFILFYVLAMVHRKSSFHHASYMILSAVPFINPGLGRFISPEVSLPVEFMLIVGLLLGAVLMKKPYKPYLVAIGSYLLLLALVVYISFIEPSVVEMLWNLIWAEQV